MEEQVQLTRRSRRLVRSITAGTALAVLAALPAADAVHAAPTASPLAIRVGDVTVVESATGKRAVSVPVSLSAPTDHDVEVTVVTSGIDATPGVDYQEIVTPKRVRIRSGKTTAHARVTVYGDEAVEADEKLQVKVVGTSDPSLPAGATGTVTIVNTEARQGRVEAQLGSTSVHEADNTATMAKVPLTLSYPLATDSMVRVETVDRSAVGGVDYRTIARDVKIRAGRVGVTVSIPVHGDLEREGDEHFSVRITSASAGVGFQTVAQGLVAIRDNEPPGPPEAVTGQVALVGDHAPGVVQLDWSAPSGVDPASKYSVDAQHDGGPWVDLGTTTDTTMTHDCGVYERTCTYRVTAINDAGPGPITAIGRITTQRLELPGTTTVRASLAGPDRLGLVGLRWWADPEGGPVDSYRLDLLQPDGTWRPLYTGTEQLLDHDCGLPGRTCTYRVTAINARGETDGPTETVRTQDVPGTPTGVSAEPFSGRVIRVSWASGTPNGGATILRYRVRMTADLVADGSALPTATWVSVTTTSNPVFVTCPGPATGMSRCRVEVRAENAVGNGAWSAGALVLTVVNPQPPKGGGGPAHPG
jgi:hypothetical protein